MPNGLNVSAWKFDVISKQDRYTVVYIRNDTCTKTLTKSRGCPFIQMNINLDDSKTREVTEPRILPENL